MAKDIEDQQQRVYRLVDFVAPEGDQYAPHLILGIRDCFLTTLRALLAWNLRNNLTNCTNVLLASLNVN